MFPGYLHVAYNFSQIGGKEEIWKENEKKQYSAIIVKHIYAVPSHKFSQENNNKKRGSLHQNKVYSS